MPVPSEADPLLKEVFARLATIEAKVDSLLVRDDETSSHRSDDNAERTQYERNSDQLRKAVLEPRLLALLQQSHLPHHRSSDAIHDYLSNANPNLKNRLQAICEPISKSRYEHSLAERELLEQYCDFLGMVDSDAQRATAALIALLEKQQCTTAGEKK